MRLFLQYQKDLPFFLLFFRMFFMEMEYAPVRWEGRDWK